MEIEACRNLYTVSEQEVYMFLKEMDLSTEKFLTY